MNIFNPEFVPYGLTKNDLNHHFKKAYKEFYLRPRIIWYFLKKLKNKEVRKKIMVSGLSFLRLLSKKQKKTNCH